MHEIPEEWLKQINRKMSDEGVPYIQRPMLAIRAWAMETGVAVRIPSLTSEHVFQWFYRNSAEKAHHIGSLFTGLFYFDVYFWPVNVPLAYGRVRLDPFTSLNAMPESVSARLRTETEAHGDYLALWADCVDYGFGRDDLRGNNAISGFAASLFTAANEHLEATIAVLREKHPNSKAMDSGRMATEIFLKTFLAAHGGLTETGARKLGHNLELALKECLNTRATSELSELQARVGQFPDVGARYEGVTYNDADLWNAYSTAQFAGSAIVRSLSDRNMRRTVELALAEASKNSASAS
jgi:hypothetical protein